MNIDHLPDFDIPVDVIVPINCGVKPVLFDASRFWTAPYHAIDKHTVLIGRTVAAIGTAGGSFWNALLFTAILCTPTVPTIRAALTSCRSAAIYTTFLPTVTRSPVCTTRLILSHTSSVVTAGGSWLWAATTSHRAFRASTGTGTLKQRIVAQAIPDSAPTSVSQEPT